MISAKTLPPPADRQRLRRALLSVSDKTGLVPFAQRLAAHGVELLSTGGTARALREAGLEVIDVADVTGFPEILDGRVKSLHPNVHGGILARSQDPEDQATLEAHGIGAIQLVAVNLYPFREAVASGADDALAADNVDIGGPTMLRAAAKNFGSVAVVVDPTDYDALAAELDANDGTLGLATRHRLATTGFRHTADYDDAIARFFEASGDDSTSDDETDVAPEALPDPLEVSLPLALPLRYGENPHQRAGFYSDSAPYQTLHGKALSTNNLLDLTAALDLIGEFADAPPTVAILKHTNPCGVGQAESLADAYRKAFTTDTLSPFGGIVVVNRALDRASAEAIDAVFTELIIAPEYEDGVLDFLQQKQNRRLLTYTPEASAPDYLLRSVAGGVLAQEPDAPLGTAAALRERCSVATQRAPSDGEWADLDFAWRVCKHVKSNAIVYAKGGATLGIGAGQMSRIDASEVAVRKAGKESLDLAGSVVASDAFFPFADGLLAAADAGAVAAIQPGGSVRDDEVIEAADARGMAMVFTGARHFRH
ncbi:bifunctional phosphoribosylaminoimidazolecarboxamide formyltransferase/IMP cyclohydrolase [Rubricoccus marinus]|uniref:Bifunctional purine biosynthesis protein PurH n=1 Tax=Rubricoccus marinus TaxID=716817 RepID=A0A259TZY4_9BACT|nr:bifunctional phosphoribosylaminoimidazolecarboxamide formyltransferase/IMP cyclohydrolase [Rubricoccus marinus]OZC03148.1 bifunctional phosphoribosylaminoimidazolecarboxamide formyltransferase/IMP cyclohydrolase [Rubricoccus marinus]